MKTETCRQNTLPGIFLAPAFYGSYDMTSFIYQNNYKYEDKHTYIIYIAYFETKSREYVEKYEILIGSVQVNYNNDLPLHNIL